MLWVLNFSTHNICFGLIEFSKELKTHVKLEHNCYVDLYNAHILFLISQKIEELQKENEKMQTALGRLESSVSITFMMLGIYHWISTCEACTGGTKHPIQASTLITNFIQLLTNEAVDMM